MYSTKDKTSWEITYFTATLADELLADETATELVSVTAIEGDGALVIGSGGHAPQLQTPLVTVWFERGGTPDERYKLAVRVKTSLGRELELFFFLEITA